MSSEHQALHQALVFNAAGLNGSESLFLLAGEFTDRKDATSVSQDNIVGAEGAGRRV